MIAPSSPPLHLPEKILVSRDAVSTDAGAAVDSTRTSCEEVRE